MSFTVDADGNQGTLHLPKFRHKDSWMTNTNKVQAGREPVYYPIDFNVVMWFYKCVFKKNSHLKSSYSASCSPIIVGTIL